MQPRPPFKMEARRRRVPENVCASDSGGSQASPPGAGPAEVKEKSRDDSDTAAERLPLVKRGLELYEEAERDAFQDGDTLQRSLRYFIQAAEGGDTEAIDWIGSFLDSLPALPPSVRVTDSLLHHMKWLRRSSGVERQVYAVAKSMFRKMAGGEGFIQRSRISNSAQSLLTDESTSGSAVVKSAQKLKGAVRELLNSAVSQSDSSVVTEETFCEAAMTYAKGQLPLESTGLSPEKQEKFREANIVMKVVDFPLETVKYVRHSTLKMIERRGVKWLWSSLPTKQLYLLLLAYILPMIDIGFILSAVSLVIFAAAFLAMAIATLQIIVNSEKIDSFKEYSTIFKYFSLPGMQINTRRLEFELIRHSIGPYITFVVALLFVAVSVSLSFQKLLLYELLCIVAGLLAFAIFVHFQIYKSPLVLLSLLPRLLTWMNLFLLLAGSWVPLPEFLFFTAKPIFSVSLFGLSLNINLMTLFALPVQLTLVIYLLVRESWHNFYSGLGPYCLFVSWWVLCRNFLVQSSLVHLLGTLVGLTLLLPVLPFIPVLILGSPLIFLFYYGLSKQFLVSLTVVILLLVLAVATGVNFKQLKTAKWLRIPFEHIILLQIVSTILLSLVAANMYASTHTPSSLPVVSVEEYATYCGPQNWRDSNNMVQTQLNCLHLEGRMLQGHGTVVSVKISRITNDAKMSLRALPSAVQTTMTCLFGSSVPECGKRENMTTCIFSKCHFHNSNQYQFEIKANTLLGNGSGLPVTLIAATHLQPAVVMLQAGDEIHFNATFAEGMGSDTVTLQVSTVVFGGHSYGKTSSEEEEEKSKLYLMTKLVSSLKSMMFLVLEVLFGYTHSF